MSVSVRIVTAVYDQGDPRKTWAGYSECITPLSLTLKIPVIVYEKDDSLPFMTSVDTDRQAPGGGRIIRLDNTGTCDYAFLYHIYANYDNLDDVTIFTKVNLREGAFGKMTDIARFIYECDRWDYSDIGSWPIRNVWNLNLIYKNRQYLEFMYEEPSKRNPFWQRSSEWYDEIFKGHPFPSSTIDEWGQGPCFAVSRSLIRRHPRSVYKYLMETYLSPYNRKDEKTDFNPTHDMFLRFWKLLFTHRAAARVKPVPHSSIEPTHNRLPSMYEYATPDPRKLHVRVPMRKPI